MREIKNQKKCNCVENQRVTLVLIISELRAFGRFSIGYFEKKLQDFGN